MSVFSRIVRKEIPSAIVYEDDDTLAFMDISPLSRGHTLVICKEEFADILATPPDLVAAVARTTKRVTQAISAALHPDGFNIVQNNGAAAGQVIFHYHVHIVPRWNEDGVSPFSRRGKSADPAALEQVAAAISAQIEQSE